MKAPRCGRRPLCALERVEKIKTFNDRLQLLQAEADGYIIAFLSELFGGKYQPYRSMVLNDICKLLE